MKKLLTMMMALALCLMMGAASADVTLEHVMDTTGYTLLEHSNLMIKAVGQNFQLYDFNGALISDEVYSAAGVDTGRVLVANTEGCVGLLAMDGTQLIPAQYDGVLVANAYWGIGYMRVEGSADDYDEKIGDAYYKVSTADVYYLPNAKCVATIQFDEIMEYEALGHSMVIRGNDERIMVYDQDFNVLASDVPYMFEADQYAVTDIKMFYDRNKYGLLDINGDVIIEAAYDGIDEFMMGLAEIRQEMSYGLIDEKGQDVLPAEYEYIYTHSMPCSVTGMNTWGVGAGYEAFGYYFVKKDGKKAFATSAGEITFVPDDLQSNGYCEGASVYDSISDKIFSADGVLTDVSQYWSLRALEASAGMLYRTCDDDYNYGVIDWHGNEVVPMTCKQVWLSGDGHYLMVQSGYKQCDLYKIVYDTPMRSYYSVTEERANTFAGALAPVQEVVPAEQAAAQETEQAAEAAPAAAESAVTVLLDTAIAQLQMDAAANGAGAKALIDSAVIMLGDTNANAAAMLGSASALLAADPATNAVSVITLLETVKTLL